ncbi:transcriptional regulator [Rouxiella sp. S1S-2]|uniref:helix-turn-helix domain-containing protein n=1 Tax=Rouxiella sp. S1S-2 TaxID=2653856 RepID=UPI001264AA82|nr:helix-turn-helix transcriptional regulator [Rouxiella sp. S1S-2]KAB7895128.1 transcriptional regulator [Rouxiella sp. S1S-2]
MFLRKEDWHHADIIASLHKQRTTLAALSRSAGLSSSTLANALSRPWPKGEWIIANALQLHPSEIWPSRYFCPKTDELLERKMRIKAHQPRATTSAKSTPPKEFPADNEEQG